MEDTTLEGLMEDTDCPAEEALRVENVVEKVLGALSWDDAWSLRSVSKVWRKESHHVLRNKIDEKLMIWKRDFEFDPYSRCTGLGLRYKLDKPRKCIDRENKQENDGNAARSNLKRYVEYLFRTTGSPDRIEFTAVMFQDLRMKHQVVQLYLNKFGANLTTCVLDLKTESVGEGRWPFHDVMERDEDESDRLFEEDCETYENDCGVYDEAAEYGEEFLDGETLRKLLFEQCKNLKKFGIINIPPKDEEEDSTLAFLTKEGKLAHELGQCEGTNIEEIFLQRQEYTTNWNPQLFYELFLISPKLSTLEFVAFYNTGPTDMIILEKLKQAKRLGNIQRLRLNIGHEQHWGFLQTASPSPKLKSLIIAQGRLNTPMFGMFLESQKESLELLEIRQPINIDNNEATVMPSTLPKLKRLLLGIGFEQSGCVAQLERIEWSQTFPALKELRITGRQWEGSLDAVFERRVCCPLGTVTKLQLPGFMTPDQIMSAFTTFPNVVELTIARQTLESSRVICNVWPKLRNLCMSSPFVSSPCVPRFVLLKGKKGKKCKKTLTQEQIKVVDLFLTGRSMDDNLCAGIESKTELEYLEIFQEAYPEYEYSDGKEQGTFTTAGLDAILCLPKIRFLRITTKIEIDREVIVRSGTNVGMKLDKLSDLELEMSSVYGTARKLPNFKQRNHDFLRFVWV